MYRMLGAGAANSAASEKTSSAFSTFSAFSWKQCLSEKGKVNCAKCSYSKSQSGLPCWGLPRLKTMGGGRHRRRRISCGDNMREIVKSGMLRINRGGTGVCQPLDYYFTYRGATEITFKMKSSPMKKLLAKARTHKDAKWSSGKAKNNAGMWMARVPGTFMIMTKLWLTHPDYAKSNTGVVLFKRVVAHIDNKRVIRADSFKYGACIQCPRWTKFTFPLDKSKRFAREHLVTEWHRHRFATRCAKRAFKWNRKTRSLGIKKSFRCDAYNIMSAESMISIF